MVKLGPLTKEELKTRTQRDATGPAEATDETAMTWTVRRRIQFAMIITVGLFLVGMVMMKAIPDEPGASLPTCRPFQIMTTGSLGP